MKDKHKAIIAIVSVYSVIGIFLLVVFIIPLLLMFRQCSYSYTYDFEYSDEQNAGFYVSEKAKDAFCVDVYLKDGESKIVIPDEYRGYKVSALGGFIGRGAPCPFEIHISEKALETLGCNEICGDYYLEKNYNYHVQEGEYENLYLYIHIGKNINEIKRVLDRDSFLFYAANITENEGEEAQIDIVYKVFAYYIVDEENKTFYSKDGKVYKKENDNLVLGFDEEE